MTGYWVPRAGVQKKIGTTTKKTRSELREPQATEARSLVGQQGPCASV